MEAVLLTNQRLHEQCTTLESELIDSAATFEAKLDDKRTVCSRVESEVEVARDRLDEQTEICKGHEDALASFNAATAPQIASQGLALMKLTSAHLASARSVALWQSRLDALNAELEEVGALTGDSASIDAKEGRLVATRNEIADLQLRVDESDVALRMSKERELLAAGEMAEAERATLRGMLVADADAVRLLSELHDAALSTELSTELKPTSSSSSAGRTVTHARLISETRDLVAERKEGALSALAALEQSVATHDEWTATQRADRADDLKLIQTERVAIEVAHEQAKRFLAEKRRQADVEQREVDRARCEPSPPPPQRSALE